MSDHQMESSPGPVVITTGRGCSSPPGLMNANLCGSICLYCMSGHVWPLQPSSLTRGRPPQPPRPLLPRPKPRWRRGAKRLDEAVILELSCERQPVRRNRINPRVIKRKMSRWGKCRPAHRGRKTLEKPLGNTVIMIH